MVRRVEQSHQRHFRVQPTRVAMVRPSRLRAAMIPTPSGSCHAERVNRRDQHPLRRAVRILTAAHEHVQKARGRHALGSVFCGKASEPRQACDCCGGLVLREF